MSEKSSHLETLAVNQDELVHIVTEGLSILNITRTEVKKNRHMMDVLDHNLTLMDAKFLNITNSLKVHLSIFEPVLTVTPSSNDNEINEPAAEIVPPAAHRYTQRTRKAPAYLQDYCAINAEGHGLRVTSV